MDLGSIPLTTLDGRDTSFGEYADGAVLVVNVASKCGFTPQYEGLQELYETYRDRGLTILGFPCNQFGFQEPGSAEKIEEFCRMNYGVTFPMFEKTHVNGKKQHPLYARLTETPDADGDAGKVKWNFEKFLIAPDGKVSRFRSGVTPDDPALVAAIEDALPE